MYRVFCTVYYIYIYICTNNILFYIWYVLLHVSMHPPHLQVTLVSRFYRCSTFLLFLFQLLLQLPCTVFITLIIIILTTEQDHTHFNSPEHNFNFRESIHEQHKKILLVLYLFNYPIKFINVF